MAEPRLRTVNKAVPPYPLNKFPAKFIERFAEDVVYMLTTKSSMSLEGDEWEQIFAHCVGAQWKPSNVGLDDVVLDNCCWSAKTVKSGSKKISTQPTVVVEIRLHIVLALTKLLKLKLTMLGKWSWIFGMKEFQVLDNISNSLELSCWSKGKTTLNI